ncbi:MAG TPA: DUF5522 domain-containing protein [Pyrinomonadaceae bacterium]|nr:DUF5522 domain-containing protein [Pyrinomonadaceae bacterium]
MNGKEDCGMRISDCGLEETGASSNPQSASRIPQLKEGEDFYREAGWVVFTARYLLRRGYCCGNGCRHCPYGEVKEEGASAETAGKDGAR